MKKIRQENIRNFCIIAHIDHGKSTLADRLLEYTGTIPVGVTDQVLDSMELEREKGITIKAQAACMKYERDGEMYLLNLIDTPGHVDFTYEVSRSLAACEGALLVIDASQGVEAQTLANVYLALEHDLEIIPVINKMDLPGANAERVKLELIEIGFDPDDAILVSAKKGWGIEDIINAIIDKVPSPEGDSDKPLQALVFDSYYDSFQGVIPHFRIINGSIKPGDEILLMRSGKVYDVSEVGIFVPQRKKVDRLSAGEVGYLVAGIKDIKNCRVGETITRKELPAGEPLPGYKPVKPMVFCGLYPVENNDYQDLKEALEKLQLNDASLVFEPETSEAMGFGFRCGFLGLLHMEIIQERLEREYKIELVTTAPSVVYQVVLSNSEVIEIDNPALFPDRANIDKVREPIVSAEIHLPSEYVGAVMELFEERRGTFKNMKHLSEERVKLVYNLPLNEIVLDFYDQLKSRTRGYATFDYEFIGYQESDLVKLDILVNGKKVDALSIITHRDEAHEKGRKLARKLKEYIPRQMFEVPIQAAIGGRIISRETIKAKRKNVLQKCYGGDVTRKRKLLEKQKEGKKRMKMVGNVEIPQEAFMAVLSVDDD